MHRTVGGGYLRLRRGVDTRTTLSLSPAPTRGALLWPVVQTFIICLTPAWQDSSRLSPAPSRESEGEPPPHTHTSLKHMDMGLHRASRALAPCRPPMLYRPSAHPAAQHKHGITAPCAVLPASREAAEQGSPVATERPPLMRSLRLEPRVPPRDLPDDRPTLQAHRLELGLRMGTGDE